jgi:hypothetical protein
METTVLEGVCDLLQKKKKKKHLAMEDIDLMFLKLKDEDWKNDLAFLVDMLEHLNNLNVIFREKTSLYTNYIQQYTLSKQNFVLKTRKINSHIFILYNEFA